MVRILGFHLEPVGAGFSAGRTDQIGVVWRTEEGIHRGGEAQYFLGVGVLEGKARAGGDFQP